MAYIRCDRKDFAETVLWTNANPTSSFATQTITLSDDITNYDIIRIEGRKNTSDDTYLEVYAIPSYLVNCSTSKSSQAGNCGIASSSGSGSTGARSTRVCTSTVANPNKIEFGSDYSMATSTSDNTRTIPTRVVGIKY